jgi:hypothetical protein
VDPAKRQRDNVRTQQTSSEEITTFDPNADGMTANVETAARQDTVRKNERSSLTTMHNQQTVQHARGGQQFPGAENNSDGLHMSKVKIKLA